MSDDELDDKAVPQVVRGCGRPQAHPASDVAVEEFLGHVREVSTITSSASVSSAATLTSSRGT